MTLGSLWKYYRNEINYDANENDHAKNKINNDKTTASESFEYKAKKKNTWNIWVTFEDLSVWYWLTVIQNLICHGQKNV